jgi:glycosyltransferase involved in cell wall biosynthesis
MSDYRYAVITPAHNEARFLPQVIRAMAAQTALPGQWLILDDRSTDGTWPLLASEASQHSFIQPVKITGPPGRRVGANVVWLFQQGLPLVSRETEFVVKMDADVVLPPHYFRELLARFAADPQLGLASGKTYNLQEGQWVLERIADSHVTGACKTYRRRCLNDMGGLVPILGWDVLDVVQARMAGWRTRSFRDLPLYHLRLTGSAQGMARANLSYGRSYYAIRAHPLFVLAKAFYRALEKPYGLSLLILAGYLMAALRREERLNDTALTRFLRQQQMQRLLGRTLNDELLLPQHL